MVRAMLNGLVATLATILLVTASPVSAQALTDTTPIKEFTLQNVQSVLRGLGAKTSVLENNGQPFVRAEMESGLIAIYQPTACTDGSDCAGLNIMAAWDRPKGWSDAKLLKALSDFENEYSFIKAGVLNDGSIYVQRYVICDFGTFAGNIRVEATTFSSIAAAFSKIVNP
ncbi:YbjN domain-containing protein [Sphingorhabdus soli]|uniref:YbjN domain-containing protein n=2 Tax=Flavisphingopyxis soli TaxID=2601267 RepID=A0A5C6U851_9SPHN|nr:YbjN domain-containing protein [Sphingorhabdus soli]